jgi:hypothetical protein
MICFAKPGLIENFCIVKERIFNNMLYVQYVHLTQTKPVHKRGTHPDVREDVT